MLNSGGLLGRTAAYVNSLLDRAGFRLRLIGAALRLPPVAGASGEGDAGDDAGGDGAGDAGGDAGDAGGDAGDAGDAGSSDDDADAKVAAGDDWKTKARKHERAAAKAAKRAAEAEAKLAEHDRANQTEQERAIAAAREEATKAVREEADREIRAERLASGVARLAAAKFADVDDAIRLLPDDVADDVFGDDGKLDTKALGDALDALLEAKPHLGRTAKAGGTDAGGGKGSGAKALEEMTVDDHLKAQRKHAPANA